MADNNPQIPVIPIEQVAPPLPAAPQGARPLGVANPARDLVAERDAEAQRDRNAADIKRQRFTARRNTTEPKPTPDAATESCILSTAVNFPYMKLSNPIISTFIPCFASASLYINYLDHQMTSTKRWTDNCMGWVPPYSQIYFAMLFYIQCFRAMDAAGYLTPGSEISVFLKEFCVLYPLENLRIPGPLALFYKNLACFWPTASGTLGNVTPAIPDTPGWTVGSRFAFLAAFATHLPNISLHISRLRSICAAATRDNTTETLFFNDIDGPHNLATLYGAACNHGEHELTNMSSPGASLRLSGGLRLWLEANNAYIFATLPENPNIAGAAIEDNWRTALRLDEDAMWFGHVAAMMARYCQFWKGSCSLADCSPNSSAAGAYKLNAVGDSDLFTASPWTAETGAHNNTQHGNANQSAHYHLKATANLQFNGRCSIEDIPEVFGYIASTYHYNLIPHGVNAGYLRHGPFWQVNPDMWSKTNMSVYQGVIGSIARDYHSDSRLGDHRD